MKIIISIQAIATALDITTGDALLYLERCEAIGLIAITKMDFGAMAVTAMAPKSIGELFKNDGYTVEV